MNTDGSQKTVYCLISTNHVNQDVKKKSSEAITFGGYTDKWPSTLKNADSTMDMKLAIIAREITSTFANKLLREISTEQVLAHCKKSGIDAYRLRRCRSEGS